MGGNSLLVWWLLAVPLLLGIVDRFMTAGGTTVGAGWVDRTSRALSGNTHSAMSDPSASRG